ncbi:hypothetical protein MTR_5g076175 [Medicago truncatula]|uniref:Uncharacterized protein n=1 Tax=Medicago truncatula TaxID=3880 RepID=A0A072UGF2_MEDTR|nr:hypothetical protein MTR_5g076175 [Medicago truncatula]
METRGSFKLPLKETGVCHHRGPTTSFCSRSRSKHKQGDSTNLQWGHTWPQQCCQIVATAYAWRILSQSP